MPLAHPPRVGPQTVEVIKTEETGSDVNLAAYLLLDGFRADCIRQREGAGPFGRPSGGRCGNRNSDGVSSHRC
jgi:hypothetical protein